MAIAETVFAVIFYLWVALLIGALLPLYVAVAAAPLVLLRSDESVALGLRWFQLFESDAPWDADWTSSWWYRLFLVIASTLLALWLLAPDAQIGRIFEFLNFDRLMKLILIVFAMTLGFVYLMMPMTVFLTSLLIRISATIVYLREGFTSLPQNFRILILCTSPAQIPELVPGLNATGSHFRFFSMRDVFKGDDPVGPAEILFVFSTVLLSRLHGYIGLRSNLPCGSGGHLHFLAKTFDWHAIRNCFSGGLWGVYGPKRAFSSRLLHY